MVASVQIPRLEPTDTLPPSTATGFKLSPIESSANFGAYVDGIDLNHLDEDAFKQLRRAVYEHKLVIIRNQKQLDPVKHYDLIARFDPAQAGADGNAKASHFGGKQNFNSAPAVPAVPQVRFVGVGTIPKGHYGTTEDIEIDLNSHRSFHKYPLSDEEMKNGNTRFQRWHCDAQFYGQYPARVTALWMHTLPPKEKGKIKIHFDDGSGTIIETMPGKTAFIDCNQMYESFSDEDKAWVENSEVEYAPSPYQWMQNCKAYGNGFRLYSEGQEYPLDQLPSNEPEKIQRLPMLWTNPLTGKKAFMVHAIIVRKLFLRHSPDAEFETIDDLETLRERFYKLQRPFLTEQNILFSPQNEGDMCLWNNRALRHSAVDLHKSWSPRLVHQAQITGSDHPAHPDAWTD